MQHVTFERLEQFLTDLFMAVGMNGENTATMVKIYSDATKRGVGHHDIYEIPSRMEKISIGRMKVNPQFQKLAGFGCMESWDGDNGLGELVNTFSMGRAIELAQQHGMGFCTVRNSNHYLASAPYVQQAAENGCIGMIIAKGLPTMSVPGAKGPVVSQSPFGFAFPTEDEWPVMLDACMAYVSFGKLKQMAERGQPVPSWWGVDENGQPTTDAKALMKGAKYPIGENKGFGLAILCEVLTGVLSDGFILDEGLPYDQRWTSSSHTAIAIKADALMPMEQYKERSTRLIRGMERLSPGIHIPGHGSYQTRVKLEEQGGIELTDELMQSLKSWAKQYHVAAI